MSKLASLPGILRKLPTDCCPCLQEEAQVNAVNFPGHPRDHTIRIVIPITMDGKIILTSAMHRTKDPIKFI
ncbi:hypothetical protein GQ457_08G027080 [Hibiscus cannabinus]